MIHDLSEGTKHAADVASAVAPVAAGTAAAITLSQVALVVTIIAALCSIIWFAVRMFDRIKYGPGMGE